MPEQPKSGFFHLIVTRPVAVTMSVLAVCVFGGVSLQKLPVTLLPEMSFPTLTVRTEYPGAAPSEVEELVTAHPRERCKGCTPPKEAALMLAVVLECLQHDGLDVGLGNGFLGHDGLLEL